MSLARRAGAAALGAALVLASGCALEDLAVRPDDGSDGGTDYLALYDDSMRAYAAGDMATAEAGFERITREVPREAEAWFRLGNVYARTKRPDAAVAAYEEALVRRPDLLKAWHNMGIVRLRQAGNSFVELRKRTRPSDPLYGRASRLTDSVLRLLEGEPGEQVSSAAPHDPDAVTR